MASYSTRGSATCSPSTACGWASRSTATAPPTTGTGGSPTGGAATQQVLRALALLRRPEYRHLYAGILCTVDVANDPVAVYEAVLAQAPPRLDLLLPHATWDQPPRREPGSHAPYAAWLGQVHDRWVSGGRPVPIRFFDSLLAAWEGRRSGSEAAGLDPVDLLVLDTDGGWEQADSLKTAYDGAPETGFEVFSHSVDDAVGHPGLAARRTGVGGLAVPAAAARSCEPAAAACTRTGTGREAVSTTRRCTATTSRSSCRR